MSLKIFANIVTNSDVCYTYYTSFQETHLRLQSQFCEHLRPRNYRGITEETEIETRVLTNPFSSETLY